MLKAIQRFFDQNMQPASKAITSVPASEPACMLATAALLIEIMRADSNVSETERQTTLTALKDRFKLTDREADELVSLAETEADEAVSLYQFTHLIDKGFSREQKVQVIELLWQVVFADQVLEKHEEALVRKISGLIHVPHKAFIDAKIRVRDRMTGGGL